MSWILHFKTILIPLKIFKMKKRDNLLRVFSVDGTLKQIQKLALITNSAVNVYADWIMGDKTNRATENYHLAKTF